MAKVALLIGVSEYAAGLNPLPAALNDIAEMENILKDPDMGGFDRVQALPNPDSQTMQIEIARFFVNRAKTDLLLLYFSGHGIRGERGDFYFATKNTQKELVVATAVPARFIHDVMNNCQSVQQAIILDSCHSEAFNPEYQTKSAAAIDFQAQLGAKGRVVLASSAFNQYSYERKGDRLSVYTQHLVEGMTTGKADIDHDGHISMQDLHDYATNCFRDSDCEMTPKMIILKGEGHKLLLSRVKSVDPGQHYRDALADILKQGKGEISAIDRYALSDLRTECGLSLEAADRYEELAIKPYREREKKIELFKYQVTDVILSGEKTGQQTETKLSQIRQSYCKILTTQDMATAEAEIREKIEALPIVTSIPSTSVKKELASSSSESHTSASQDCPKSDKVKRTNLTGAALLMKPWMRLSYGLLGLCGLLSAGYFLSLNSQPQQLSASRQQLLANESQMPANSTAPSNGEAERIKQHQIDENYRTNQRNLDRAEIELDRDDWKSWERSIDYAKQAVNSGDLSQVRKANEIIRKVEGKMADELRRAEQVKNSLQPKSSPTPIAEPRASPVVSPPVQQSPNEVVTFPSGSSSSTNAARKAQCAELEEKYNNLDISTRDKVNSSGSTIRQECNDLGVVINH
jgi:hypothetical protein